MKSKRLLMPAICLLAISLNVKSDDHITVPAEVKPFVENGTKAIVVESADLNGDGLKDYVLVLERENAAENMETGYSDNQRPLLILVRGADNKLMEAKRNEKIVMCSKCGGVWGDPFEGVKVGKNTFTVNHYGGSNWRWSTNYKFNYSRIDKTWQLVKIEKISFHTAEPNKVDRKVMTPPRDYGKVDIADFDPADYEEKVEEDPVSDSGDSEPAKTNMMDVSAFNQKIEKSAAAGENWVKFPTQVLAAWLPEFNEFATRSIEMKSDIADITDYLTIIVTDDGYADDSIRGERFWIELKKDGAGIWKLVSAKSAQVCRENRGHQYYSTERCS